MTVTPVGPAYGSTYLTRSAYLTPLEFKAEPTGLELDDLVPVSSSNPTPTQADQDLAIQQAIDAASSWMDEQVFQTLGATVQTEVLDCRPTGLGIVALHPAQWPILEVTALSLGADPLSLNALTDLTTVLIQPQIVSIYPGLAGAWTSVGPLQFGPLTGARPGVPLLAQLTYVAGWPNTLLTAPVAVGAASLTVASVTGICPPLPQGGTAQSTLMLYDGATKEPVTVTAADPATGVCTLAGAVAFNHPQGTRLSGLPPALRKACVLATTAMVKTRGSEAYVTGSAVGVPHQVARMEPGGTQELALAADLLRDYAAVAATP